MLVSSQGTNAELHMSHNISDNWNGVRGKNGFYADGSDDYGTFNLGNNHGPAVAMGSNAQVVGGAFKQRRFLGFLCTQGDPGASTQSFNPPQNSNGAERDAITMEDTKEGNPLEILHNMWMRKTKDTK